MSIWNDITKAGLFQPMKELSFQDIRDFMIELEKPEVEQRQFVVQTGKTGMSMINHAMQAQVYLDSMKRLNFSREERKSLGKMINSSDNENFEVAKVIINNKLAEAKEYHK